MKETQEPTVNLTLPRSPARNLAIQNALEQGGWEKGARKDMLEITEAMWKGATKLLASYVKNRFKLTFEICIVSLLTGQLFNKGLWKENEEIYIKTPLKGLQEYFFHFINSSY